MSVITEDSFNWGVSGQLLRALLFPGPSPGQGAPVAGQVPQLAPRGLRHHQGHALAD